MTVHFSSNRIKPLVHISHFTNMFHWLLLERKEHFIFAIRQTSQERMCSELHSSMVIRGTFQQGRQKACKCDFWTQLLFHGTKFKFVSVPLIAVQKSCARHHFLLSSRRFYQWQQNWTYLKGIKRHRFQKVRNPRQTTGEKTASIETQRPPCILQRILCWSRYQDNYFTHHSCHNSRQ